MNRNQESTKPTRQRNDKHHPRHSIFAMSDGRLFVIPHYSDAPLWVKLIAAFKDEQTIELDTGKVVWEITYIRVRSTKWLLSARRMATTAFGT